MRLLILTLLLLAVVAPAASAAPFAMGVHDARLHRAHPTTQPAHFGQISGIGADVVRLTMFWDTVAARCGSEIDVDRLRNHTHRCYDWSATDASVRLANERGMSVLVSVFGAPAWVTGSADLAYTGDTRAQFDGFAARFADFAEAAATRYAAAGTLGFVRYWTIWNEPNGALFWKPLTDESPIRYADLYAASAARMKAASPTSLVAPGPTAPNSRPLRPGLYIPVVQRRLEELGAGHLVDAWAHNPYPGGNVSPFEGFWKTPSIGIGNIQDLFTLLDASAVTAGKPVWAVEFAYQTNPPDIRLGAAPADQAIWMAEAMDVAWTTGRMPIFEWYLLQDPRNADTDADWESGMFDGDGAEKPSAAMFRRPISVRRLEDGRLRIWGASNVAPDSGELVMRRPGEADWTVLAAERHDDGVLLAYADLPDGVVAVRDASGVGPARDVAMAWRPVPPPPPVQPPAPPSVVAPRAATETVATPLPTTQYRVVLRQQRPGSRAFRAATCGRSLARACTYRRVQQRTLRAVAPRVGYLPTRVTWQLRTARGWRTVRSTSAILRNDVVRFTQPKALRGRVGMWRVRVAPYANGSAVRASDWQYLRVR